MVAEVSTELVLALNRIADALEKGRTDAKPTDFGAADAFSWVPETHFLKPVKKVAYMDISLLQAIDRVKEQLLTNTRRFANRLPANNVLLWGARGMGKSSLVKAVHAAVNNDMPGTLKLIEINREDIETLPELMDILRNEPHQFIVFCDDLSFEASDTSYKSLKSILEGGVEGRPDNVVFYATSNRRHLMPRTMMDNESVTTINSGEAIEEVVSLSDRFGLWLGFHKCSQDDYLAMVNAYIRYWKLPVDENEVRADALEWAVTRGSRSGRTAWQFIRELAGRLGCSLN
jgi:predicted AAA+ superfamily ATPase